MPQNGRAYCLSALLVLSIPDASANLRQRIADAGYDPLDAKMVDVVWRRSERFSGASTTINLLSGSYYVFAAGDVPKDLIDIEVLDKGTGDAVGRVSLSNEFRREAQMIVVRTASICLLRIKPGPEVVSRRVASYKIAVGFIREAGHQVNENAPAVGQKHHHGRGL